MKISFAMIVVNGEKFLPTQLRSIYPHAHEIVICEGGDQFWNSINGFHRSTDRTVEIIRSFPDPDKKIRLIQDNWENKNQMAHAYSRYLTGDYAWHVDVDELVDPEDILPAVKGLQSTGAQCASIPQYVFWGDKDTVLQAHGPKGWQTFWAKVPRIYRWKSGMTLHHLPMGYWVNGAVTTPQPMSQQYFLERKIFCYHFSWVFPDEVGMKMRYYDHRIRNAIKPDWYEKVWLQFPAKGAEWKRSNFNIQPVRQSFKERIRAFGGKHPEFLSEFLTQLS